MDKLGLWTLERRSDQERACNVDYDCTVVDVSLSAYALPLSNFSKCI